MIKLSEAKEKKYNEYVFLNLLLMIYLLLRVWGWFEHRNHKMYLNFSHTGLHITILTNTKRSRLPGQYIASSVVDSVQRSRHTLIILTRALLQSEWCRYELQMALMEEAHSDRDVPIFLLYDDVPSQELPHEVLFNIQAHSYIEFPHSEINREPFWKRLSEALRN